MENTESNNPKYGKQDLWRIKTILIYACYMK